MRGGLLCLYLVLGASMLERGVRVVTRPTDVKPGPAMPVDCVVLWSPWTEDGFREGVVKRWPRSGGKGCPPLLQRRSETKVCAAGCSLCSGPALDECFECKRHFQLTSGFCIARQSLFIPKCVAACRCVAQARQRCAAIGGAGSARGKGAEARGHGSVGNADAIVFRLGLARSCGSHSRARGDGSVQRLAEHSVANADTEIVAAFQRRPGAHNGLGNGRIARGAQGRDCE